jgi:hypothetical protein
MQNCQNCAAPVREEMKFCPGCGKSLQNQTPDENTALGGGTEKIESTASVLDQEPHETEANKTSVSSETPQPQPPVGQITKKTWIVTAVFGVAALVGLLALEGVNTANENAESAKLSQRAEVAAQECANIIGQHVAEVASARVISHAPSIERTRVDFRDSNGRDVGDSAQCEYSRYENILSVESIEWVFDRGGVPTNVTYSRETNLVEFKPIPKPSAIEDTTTERATSCQSAFQRAAAVPLSRDNNAEIAETTRACADVDEWWATLKRYPDVFGVSRFSESERGLYVGSACTVGGNSPVCRDADMRGIGF